MHYLSDIVGFTTKKAYRTSEGFALDTDWGILDFQPYGDCCSTCTVTDMCFTEALFDAKILKVEDIVLPDPAPKEYDDVVNVWGYRIHTTKGICTISMRLDHNGYYGGSLNVYEEDEKFLTGLSLLTDFC